MDRDLALLLLKSHRRPQMLSLELAPVETARILASVGLSERDGDYVFGEGEEEEIRAALASRGEEPLLAEFNAARESLPRSLYNRVENEIDAAADEWYEQVLEDILGGLPDGDEASRWAAFDERVMRLRAKDYPMLVSVDAEAFAEGLAVVRRARAVAAEPPEPERTPISERLVGQTLLGGLDAVLLRAVTPPEEEASATMLAGDLRRIEANVERGWKRWAAELEEDPHEVYIDEERLGPDEAREMIFATILEAGEILESDPIGRMIAASGRDRDEMAARARGIVESLTIRDLSEQGGGAGGTGGRHRDILERFRDERIVADLVVDRLREEEGRRVAIYEQIPVEERLRISALSARLQGSIRRVDDEE